MLRSRRRSLIVLLACGLLLSLVIAIPAVGKLTAQNDLNTILFTGTEGNDVVDVQIVPGVADPTQKFIQVHDPDGIDGLPTGCFRKDAETIHCPVSIDLVQFDLLDGNDILIIDLNETEVEVDGDGGDGNDQLEGGDEADNFKGGAGKDIESGAGGNDDLDGGNGNDKQNGGAGNDKLKGGKGKDVQKGGAGHDKLIGGPGDDKQNGGGSSDTCNGGPGQETVTGCEQGFAY